MRLEGELRVDDEIGEVSHGQWSDSATIEGPQRRPHSNRATSSISAWPIGANWGGLRASVAIGLPRLRSVNDVDGFSFRYKHQAIKFFDPSISASAGKSSERAPMTRNQYRRL